MADSIPEEDITLRYGLSESLNTGKFSDLIVKCSDGEEYKVHKIILCAQSPVFMNACDPQRNFKEAKEGVIELKEDSPEVVRAMLEYLYRSDYSVPEDSGMVFHVQAYAMGEIYGVQGLKELAKGRFKKTASASWACPTFSAAVKAVYYTTPEMDRGLRDIAVEIGAAHVKSLIKDENFRNMMDEIGPFGKDMTQYLEKSFREDKALKTYRCFNGCGKNMEMVIPQEVSNVYCLRCGRNYQSNSWKPE